SPPYTAEPELRRPATPVGFTRTYFGDAGGWAERVPVVRASAENAPLQGPASVVAAGTTVVVDPGATAYFTASGSIVLHSGAVVERVTPALDLLLLSVFSHRFMSIAEQMGYALQRTAISTNIKERLDFSCAIFDAEGNLVANAPHIPVHL